MLSSTPLSQETRGSEGRESPQAKKTREKSRSEPSICLDADVRIAIAAEQASTVCPIRRQRSFRSRRDSQRLGHEASSEVGGAGAARIPSRSSSAFSRPSLHLGSLDRRRPSVVDRSRRARRLSRDPTSRRSRFDSEAIDRRPLDGLPGTRSARSERVSRHDASERRDRESSSFVARANDPALKARLRRIVAPWGSR